MTYCSAKAAWTLLVEGLQAGVSHAVNPQFHRLLSFFFADFFLQVNLNRINAILAGFLLKPRQMVNRYVKRFHRGVFFTATIQTEKVCFLQNCFTIPCRAFAREKKMRYPHKVLTREIAIFAFLEVSTFKIRGHVFFNANFFSTNFVQCYFFTISATFFFTKEGNFFIDKATSSNDFTRGCHNTNGTQR